MKGITGETCAHLYTNRVGFTKLYPLITESKAHESLTRFIHKVGISHELHSDNAKALIQGDYRRKVKKYEIYTTETEPYYPWQNNAEREEKNSEDTWSLFYVIHRYTYCSVASSLYFCS